MKCHLLIFQTRGILIEGNGYKKNHTKTRVKTKANRRNNRKRNEKNKEKIVTEKEAMARVEGVRNGSRDGDCMQLQVKAANSLKAENGEQRPQDRGAAATTGGRAGGRLWQHASWGRTCKFLLTLVASGSLYF